MSSYWLDHSAEFHSLFPPVKEYLYRRIAQGIDESRSSRACRVLDFGCGDGKLMQYLKEGTEVDIFDVNQEFYESIHRKSTHLVVQGINARDQIELNTYGALVLSMVIMCIAGAEEVNACFRDLYSFAQREAVLIVTVTHPCFRDKQFSYFRTEYFGKSFNYLEEGTPFKVEVSMPGAEISFTDYHWSLQFVMRASMMAGWRLKQFEEVPDQEFNGSANQEYPPYMILTFQKTQQ